MFRLPPFHRIQKTNRNLRLVRGVSCAVDATMGSDSGLYASLESARAIRPGISMQ